MRCALAGEDISLDKRKQAVDSLCIAALPPGRSTNAEDALHRILKEGCSELRTAAEEALRQVWHDSGDEAVNRLLEEGTSLMKDDQHEQAVVIFSSVIEKAPGFAEGWNKRATARFLMEDYERSVSDCHRVLELKPRHHGCLTGLGMCLQALARDREAVEAFRKAIELNPGLQHLREAVEGSDLNTVINDNLRPEVVRVARNISEALGGRSQSPGTRATSAQAMAGAVECDWDVHLVDSAQASEIVQQSRTYLVRVRVRNAPSASSAVKSLARFYALCFAGGRIFPLMRVTEGSSAFSLDPGEDYRYCFYVEVLHELVSVAGGVLMESDSDASGTARAAHFVYRDLQQRPPARATADEIERQMLGYFHTGHLNLCHLNLGELPKAEPRVA